MTNRSDSVSHRLKCQGSRGTIQNRGIIYFKWARIRFYQLVLWWPKIWRAFIVHLDLLFEIFVE